MNQIKRYSLLDSEMHECPDGEYIKVADLSGARDKLHEAIARLEMLKASILNQPHYHQVDEPGLLSTILKKLF